MDRGLSKYLEFSQDQIRSQIRLASYVRPKTNKEGGENMTYEKPAVTLSASAIEAVQTSQVNKANQSKDSSGIPDASGAYFDWEE